MALSDYTPAKSAVIYRGKTLVEVRGLSLEDVTILVRSHIPDLRKAYDIWESRKLLPEFINDEIETLLVTLLTLFPDTAARMIALGSDEPDGVDAAKRLPMPLQIKIMASIIDQTFEDVGGPLVFAAMLRLKLQSLTTAANTQSTGSTENIASS